MLDMSQCNLINYLLSIKKNCIINTFVLSLLYKNTLPISIRLTYESLKNHTLVRVFVLLHDAFCSEKWLNFWLNKQIALKVISAENGNLSYQISCKNKSIIEPSMLSFALSRPETTLNKFQMMIIEHKILYVCVR